MRSLTLCSLNSRFLLRRSPAKSFLGLPGRPRFNARPLALLLAGLLLVACSDADNASSNDGTVESAANTLAITNVTVIDAVDGRRSGQTVLINGNEIVAVQPASTPVDAAGVIDGSGKFLIPGLWDFHVHLTYEEGLQDAMPALFASYGITSVRDTGGLLDAVLPVVETMRADPMAPRVFFAGPLLDGEFVVYDGDGRPEIGTSVPTLEAARQTVQALYDQGASFIKIYEMVSPEVFVALVDAAEELGMPIDSHVPLSMRASLAGPQVDSIEHLRNIEMDCAANAPELLAIRRQRLENPDGLSGAELRASLHAEQRLPAVTNYHEGQCDRTIAALDETVMVPTLRLNSFNLTPAWERDGWEDALSRLPEDMATQWRSQAQERSAQPTGDTTFAQWSLFLTERMYEAGVPIGAGTDTPINLSVPGFSLHSELEMLVHAGLTPLDAIGAATIEPARYFSLENEMGRITPGHAADLVLLDADPEADIANTRSINSVIMRGRLLGQ